MTWTRFMDMHSGGKQKLNWSKIYIEAPEQEAAAIFQSRFGRNPNHITCTCCGEDYSFYFDYETLEEASGFDRRCDYDNKLKKYVERNDKKWTKYGEKYAFIPFEEWLKKDGDTEGKDSFCLVRKETITEAERNAPRPRSGHFEWVEDD